MRRGVFALPGIAGEARARLVGHVALLLLCRGLVHTHTLTARRPLRHAEVARVPTHTLRHTHRHTHRRALLLLYRLHVIALQKPISPLRPTPPPPTPMPDAEHAH